MLNQFIAIRRYYKIIRRNNSALSFFLYSILILSLSTPAFAAEGPVAGSSFETTRQEQAANFMREEIGTVVEKLLKDFPKDVHLIKRTVSLYQLLFTNKAISILEQGLKDIPNNFELHSIIAHAYFNDGQYERAVTHWKKALEISPKTLETHDNIAESLIHLGRYNEAVEILEAKIKISAKSDRSYWLLGRSYIQLNQLDKAKECYEKAIKINPKHSQGNYWLARLYTRLKQPAEAKKYMRVYEKSQAKKEKRRHMWAQKRGAIAADDSSNMEIEALPKTLTALSFHAYKLYKAKNDTEKSQWILARSDEIFKKAIAIDPEQHMLYQQFSFLYLGTNRKLDKAKEYAEKAIDLKETGESYFILGLIYERNSEPKKAMAAIEKAIRLEPKNIKYGQKYTEMIKRNK